MGTDLKPALHCEAELLGLVADLWRRRDDRYSEERQRTTGSMPHAEMAYLGG